MANLEFGSEYTFKVDGKIVKPGSLLTGQVVQIIGQAGEYKVLKKTKEKNKLFFRMEKMPTYLFKTYHQGLKQVFGVEAVCGRNQPGVPTEFQITVRGKKQWVHITDCMGQQA